MLIYELWDPGTWGLTLPCFSVKLRLQAIKDGGPIMEVCPETPNLKKLRTCYTYNRFSVSTFNIFEKTTSF